MKIPISEAKKLAVKYKCDEVAIMGRRYNKEDPKNNSSEVLTTTYGKTKKACKFIGDAMSYFLKVVENHARDTKSD